MNPKTHTELSGDRQREPAEQQPGLEYSHDRGDRHLKAAQRILALAALAGWVIYSGLYTVPAESVGLIQRFGKYQTEVGPGLQMKIPFGIDKATLVPIKRQLKEEFGFGTSNATYASQVSSPDQWQLETTMVTGDLNTALVEWIIQFRIEKSFDFLFKVRNPGETLRYVSESVMREVIGDRTVDAAAAVEPGDQWSG